MSRRVWSIRAGRKRWDTFSSFSAFLYMQQAILQEGDDIRISMRSFTVPNLAELHKQKEEEDR